MLEVIFFSVAIAGVPASLPAYPAVEIMSALNEVCGSERAISRIASGNVPLGWEKIDLLPDDPLLIEMAANKSAKEKLFRTWERVFGDFITMKRTVNDRHLWLGLLSYGVADRKKAKINTFECALHDFEVTETISDAVISELTGNKPVRFKTIGQEYTTGTWDPGISGKKSLFYLRYMTPRVAKVLAVNFSGLQLIAVHYKKPKKPASARNDR